ncbi:MAG: M50 family metallopeptidase, partial [Desulfotomaculales bacterium]
GRMLRPGRAPPGGHRRVSRGRARSGPVGGVLMVVGGVVGFVCGRNGLDIMITGLFLAYAATRERGQVPYLYVRCLAAKNREVLAGKVLKASTLAALESVPLRQLAAHLRPGTFCLVWVLSPDLELRGIVSEGRVVEGLFHRGGHTKVGELLP